MDIGLVKVADQLIQRAGRLPLHGHLAGVDALLVDLRRQLRPVDLVGGIDQHQPGDQVGVLHRRQLY